MLAYQTPAKVNMFNYQRQIQYDLNWTYHEFWLAGVDNQEELGSTLEIERDEWSDIREDPVADLKTGTHCKRWKRDGNKCCDRAIYEMVSYAVDEINTSPEFNTSRYTEGVIANVRLISS